jgi:hypothetical protein
MFYQDLKQSQLPQPCVKGDKIYVMISEYEY